MAEFDLVGARRSGVPDAEIANALAPKLNYDLDGARKAGVSDTEIADALSAKFNSTLGGAAVGNPQMLLQSRNLRPNANLGGGATIGGAAAIGGVMGAVAPEILTGLGAAAGAFPATAGMAPALTGMANVIRGGRGASAAVGAIGGAVGETAGQTVEGAGGGPVAAEAARFAGGAIGGEALTLGKFVINKILSAPALSVESKVWKEMAKAIRDKLDGAPQSLTDVEKKFVEEQVAALRGPAGKTDAPLERVGSIMGEQGQRLLDSADQQMIAAMNQASQVGRPGAFGGKENADIGGRLRDVITTRNQAGLDARSAQYKTDERLRDAVVSSKENNPVVHLRQNVSDMPEYGTLIDELKGNLTSGKRSPSVQSNYDKILSELTNSEKDVFGQNKPVSFRVLDDVRRKLGDAFRGKPAEGYESIGDVAAKDLYQKISDLQKKYAGPVQAKLLDDYHASTEGLQVFSSRLGKKATALDQYRPEQYATDPSTLPSTYFKTRASVQALKELTGSNATVSTAALEHADKELVGKTAPQVREWMTKNGEWLAEVRPVQVLVDKYATRLEASERSLKSAKEFAELAAKDAALLTRQSLPAQRAVDLIKSGDTELWGKVAPAIMASPQAKQQMVSAVRQVVADQATSKGTIDLYARNIRPFLENANITTKAELDLIAQQLDKIQRMEIPEPEKLGIARRLLLQSTGTWAASAASRGGVGAYNYMANQVPNDQPYLERR